MRIHDLVESNVVKFKPRKSDQEKYADAFSKQHDDTHRYGVGQIACKYCGEVNCDYDCDASQADGELDESAGTTLKDLATVKTNMQDADFWLVRKGSSKTVGKPVREFNPEHIGIKVTRTDVLDPQYLYYVFMNLHNQGYFAQRATGILEMVHIRTSDVADIKFSQ